MAAAAAFVQYLLVAVWLLNVQSYLLLDGASRTITAEILVLSRDPHLGAMGFYWPPLPMLVRVPFVLLLAPFEQSIYSGAVSTALLSALVIPVLAAIARELRLSTAQTAVLVALYALNPVVVFYAANGMSEASFSLFLAISYLGYLRFSNSRAITDLRLLSVGLALGMMSRIEFIPLTIAFLVACLMLLPRDHWKRAAFLIVLPPFYVFILWTWASSILQGDAFYWYTIGKASGTTPSDHPWLPHDLTVTSILGFVLKTTLTYAPVLVILVVLVAVRGIHRLRWLGMLATAGVVPAFVALQLMLRSSNGAQRYFATLTIVGCIAAMWSVSATEHLRRSWRLVVAGLAGTSMAAAGLWVIPLNNDRYQSSLQGESAFFGPLSGAEPAGYVNKVDLRAVQSLVEDLDNMMRSDDRVAMDSQGGLAFLYSRHPDRFILPEDRDFEAIMSDPEGRFNYVIRPEVGLNSQFRVLIDNAMASMVKGKFVLVKKVQVAELWMYVPNRVDGAVPAQNDESSG